MQQILCYCEQVMTSSKAQGEILEGTTAELTLYICIQHLSLLPVITNHYKYRTVLVLGPNQEDQRTVTGPTYGRHI